MDKTTTNHAVISGPIDCACVIYGQAYDWTYVDKLYNMLVRHISPGIKFHVYTEASRPVPAHMFKHELEDFGQLGPRRAWWHKMQLFDTKHHGGPLLYFDLDTVIVDNIDWIWQLPLTRLWTVKDFKELWKPTYHGINSSVMWWDTRQFYQVWQQFKTKSLNEIMRRYPGDQDYLTATIADRDLGFFEQDRVKSWRWQCKDGGYDFAQRRHVTPGTGTKYPKKTSILCFHGKPKPKDVQDPVIQSHWK